MLPETRRRANLYSRRAWRSVTGGLRYKCFFMHLPKCGGSSLAAGLCGTVPLQKPIGEVGALATRRATAITHFGRDDVMLCHDDLAHGHLTFDLRAQMTLTLMAQGAQLIHGHVLFSDLAWQHFCDRYRFVTMMREPRARALSNFAMAVRAGAIPDDLDLWLEGPVGRSMAQVNLRYLGGRNVVSDGDLPARMDRAMQNLAHFTLIGFLDDLDGFQRQFAELFGPRPHFPHLNAAPSGAVTLSPDQETRLAALLTPDRTLYDAARARFGELPKPATNTDVSQPDLIRQSP